MPKPKGSAKTQEMAEAAGLAEPQPQAAAATLNVPDLLAGIDYSGVDGLGLGQVPAVVPDSELQPQGDNGVGLQLPQLNLTPPALPGNGAVAIDLTPLTTRVEVLGRQLTAMEGKIDSVLERFGAHVSKVEGTIDAKVGALFKELSVPVQKLVHGMTEMACAVSLIQKAVKAVPAPQATPQATPQAPQQPTPPAPTQVPQQPAAPQQPVPQTPTAPQQPVAPTAPIAEVLKGDLGKTILSAVLQTKGQVYPAQHLATSFAGQFQRAGIQVTADEVMDFFRAHNHVGEDGNLLVP